jgi:NAD(P)-dependent dehydrogenase (short-subunit alcohol dehydrogenase family)
MKTVLITGATSGIGLALVEQYSLKNYHIIAAGRNQLKLNELKVKYKNVQPLAFDITDNEQVKSAISTLENLDLVILNAGNCEYIDDVSNFDGALFERVIKVNLVSVGYLVSAVVEKIAVGGRLTFVSSSVTNLPFQRAEAYGASKAGLDYLAKSLAVDLAPLGIEVSLVHPGFIKTPLTDKNDFKMPFLLSAEDAAERIVRGLDNKKFLIQFPMRFMLILKAASLLPMSLLIKLSTRKS